jgi:GNAT superfamily N-acetyltransferase
VSAVAGVRWAAIAPPARALRDLVLRPVEAADLDRVARLQTAAIMALGAPTYGLARALAWARLGVEVRHQLLGEGAFYLAEQRGEVVGVGGWSPDGLEADLAWIRYLFVHPRLGLRGLGRRLMAEAERSARAADRRRFQVWSSLNAVPFYGALGYVPLRPGRWPVRSGLEMDHLLLAKDV